MNKTPFGCRVFGLHDWTEESHEIKPSPVERLLKNGVYELKGMLAGMSMDSVLITEICRRCGAKRTRIIQ